MVPLYKIEVEWTDSRGNWLPDIYLILNSHLESGLKFKYFASEKSNNVNSAKCLEILDGLEHNMNDNTYIIRNNLVLSFIEFIFYCFIKKIKK